MTIVLFILGWIVAGIVSYIVTFYGMTLIEIMRPDNSRRDRERAWEEACKFTYNDAAIASLCIVFAPVAAMGACVISAIVLLLLPLVGVILMWNVIAGDDGDKVLFRVCRKHDR